MSTRGKFIVIYGANGVGKTTQAEILSVRLNAQLLKYPIYDLEPTGPAINNELRGSERHLSDYELQKLFAQNRRDFEPLLESMLEDGINVVTEDYKGTGIAWGMAKGIDSKIMEDINVGLIEPDVCILLDGNQFASGRERGHRYEDSPDWIKARDIHLCLADKYGWEVINANEDKEIVASQIWEIVGPH